MPRKPKNPDDHKPDHRITLDITDEIINYAVRADSGSCIVADAIKAQIPGASAVSVDLATIRWSDKRLGKRYTYLTPDSAQLAVFAFDRGMRPSPQRLVLRRPIQVTEIKAASTAQRKQRAERLATLEAKNAAEPEKMTPREKASLTSLRQVAKRPTSQGRKTVDSEGTIHGGTVLPTTPGATPGERGGKRGAIPELLPARARTFGARKANPSKLDELLDDAVARGREQAKREGK